MKSRIMDLQDLELPVICNKGGGVQEGDSTNVVSLVCIGKPAAYTFRWKDKVTEWKGGTIAELVFLEKKNVKNLSGLFQGILAAADASDVTVANGDSTEPQPLTLPSSVSFPSSFASCPLLSGVASSLSCSTYTVAPASPRMGIRFIFRSFRRNETCPSEISPLSLLRPERQAICGGSVPFWSWGCSSATLTCLCMLLHVLRKAFSTLKNAFCQSCQLECTKCRFPL